MYRSECPADIRFLANQHTFFMKPSLIKTLNYLLDDEDDGDYCCDDDDICCGCEMLKWKHVVDFCSH